MKRPEQATDGNTTDYSGSNGFAEYSPLPSSYTLDLGKEFDITVIRFLLWDGISNARKTDATSFYIDDRQYYFSLLGSVDNIYWETYYQTNEGGSNGWQIFEFVYPRKMRYIRLTCTHNTANNIFHIVEFEVHDFNPPNILPNINTHYRRVFDTLLDSEKVSKTISEQLNQKLTDFQRQTKSVLDAAQNDAGSIKSLRDDLQGKSGNLDKIIQNLSLVGRSLHFHQEAAQNSKLSYYWLWASIILTGAFFIFLIIIIFIAPLYSFESIRNHLAKSSVQSFNILTLYFEFAGFIVLKILFLSIVLYAIVFAAKNYRIQRHNYTVNQQKAMSLLASVEILDMEKLNEQTKGQIIM